MLLSAYKLCCTLASDSLILIVQLSDHHYRIPDSRCRVMPGKLQLQGRGQHAISWPQGASSQGHGLEDSMTRKIHEIWKKNCIVQLTTNMTNLA